MFTGAVHPLEPPGGPADEELVQQVLAGRRACFEQLVRRHERRLQGAVRGLMRDRSEVEDVVQQAFAQAFAGLEGFARTATFATWLTRIAVNEALLRARRSRLVREAVVALAPRAPVAPGTPEQEAGWREAVGRVQAAVSRLPDRHRLVLQLLADGLSHAEVAASLGIRVGAARVRAHRAREALRASVGGGARRQAGGGTPRIRVEPGGPGLRASARQELPRPG
jgi:RNA polymerase sigma-70 factor, ECF subfamily